MQVRRAVLAVHEHADAAVALAPQAGREACRRGALGDGLGKGELGRRRELEASTKRLSGNLVALSQRYQAAFLR